MTKIIQKLFSKAILWSLVLLLGVLSASESSAQDSRLTGRAIDENQAGVTGAWHP